MKIKKEKSNYIPLKNINLKKPTICKYELLGVLFLIHTLLKAQYNFNNYIDKNIDQKFIHINIECNNINTYIVNTVNYILKAKKRISHFLFEFAPHFTIDSIKLNTTFICNYYYNNDSLLIFLPHEIDSGNNFEVSITYRGYSNSGIENRGLINSYNQQYNSYITWTLSQPFHAKHWLPIKQDLSDRFDSAWIYIIVDSSLKAGSQGILFNITQLPNGKVRYEWRESYPIVYYLLSIAVGKYIEYNFKVFLEEINDSLLVMNYLYNEQCLIDNKAKIDFTADLIKLFNKLFGLYPFYKEKYGHCMVPFNGGMEHQTMTSIGYFFDFLVAHELAHMWFGNNITCASWQDIWINEGFASYAEYLYKEFLYGREVANETIKHFQSRARKEPQGSVYVPFEEINNEKRIFNSNLSYKKGACLLHMIRYLCENDSLFFETLKQLQIIYNDSILTGHDVKTTFEEVTGKNFTKLFDEFYYGKGFPIYNIQWWQDTTCIRKTLFIRIMQRSSSNENKVFTIPLQFKVEFDNSDTLIKVHPTDHDQTFSFPLKKYVTNLVFDPYDFVLDSLESFNKIYALSPCVHYIKIFPNPFEDYIYIAGITKSSIVKIFNTFGNLIREIIINQYFDQVNLKQIQKGIYIIEILSDEYSIRKKIIKL
ncbi:MAG: M1 family aminopeptidase [Bacteroidales bacterium]|nr:M1 family aminopeptidase [Bacteroidales bacterium]